LPIAAIGLPTLAQPMDEPTMAQVTSVSQLSDVRPTDWAFQALQGLVERDGCVAGYPDRTFRGSRALTRFEFAAALNACMERVPELIGVATETTASKADRENLTRLQQAFATEIALLRGRVDGVEAKAARLEGQQFSTTTRLYGQAVMGLQGTNRTDVDFFPRDGVAGRLRLRISSVARCRPRIGWYSRPFPICLAGAIWGAS
jgi:S-layer homology domain/Carbohydrate-selective porin, OprB family